MWWVLGDRGGDEPSATGRAGDARKAQADQARHDRNWSSCTGRLPLGFLAGLLTLALVFLVLGLVYQRRDAPLRRPDLPMVHGTVLDRPGQAHDCDGSHAAEGRELTVVFRWSGRPPALETLTPIRFVSGDS